MFLLQMLRRWLVHPLAAADDGTAAYPSISAFYTRWVFFLLAALDPQLSSEEIASLRLLARTCISCIASSRARLARESPADTDDAQHASQLLECEAGTWMVVSAVADMWGQHDLWDELHASLGRK